MTSKNSSLSKLKSQADGIAKVIAAAERGEVIDPRFKERLKAARDSLTFKVGIIMDDKIITIELPWDVIKSTGEVGLAEYILNQMRELRNTVQ